MIFRLLCLILIGLAATGCVSLHTPDRDSGLTLVYSGNLNGELEPCGCSEEGDLGGIKRTVHMLDTLRAKAPDLILVSSGGLLISENRQSRLTSQYILKGSAALHYDAIGVQWRDLAYGKEFLAQDKLPFVVSNWKGTDFKTVMHIKRGRHILSFFQWLEPAEGPETLMRAELSPVDKNPQALAAGLRAAKEAGNITLLASTLTLEDAQQRLPLDNVDILIIQSQHEIYGEPRKIGKMLVLQPGSRGMRLGKLDFSLDEKGEVSAWQHQVIPLPKSVGDAPRMAAWYEAYNAEVKADYEKSVALKKQNMVSSPYAGETVCKTCHEREYAVWSQSRHAGAFYALQDVNKAFDPNCIVCHTVGFDKPGGFIDPQVTPELMHVQCESCHGAGKQHADSGGQQAVPRPGQEREQICRQCHQPSHSPGFNFETYWPKIAHGKAVAAGH